MAMCIVAVVICIFNLRKKNNKKTTTFQVLCGISNMVIACIKVWILHRISSPAH